VSKGVADAEMNPPAAVTPLVVDLQSLDGRELARDSV